MKRMYPQGISYSPPRVTGACELPADFRKLPNPFDDVAELILNWFAVESASIRVR